MDRSKDVLARLLQRNPAIDPATMGTRRYISFKAGDGIELDGYLTVPTGVAEPRNMPMVLVARSEEHTSELQSLMRISYAVFCLKKKTTHNVRYHHPVHKRHE